MTDDNHLSEQKKSPRLAQYTTPNSTNSKCEASTLRNQVFKINEIKSLQKYDLAPKVSALIKPTGVLTDSVNSLKVKKNMAIVFLS